MVLVINATKVHDNKKSIISFNYSLFTFLIDVSRMKIGLYNIVIVKVFKDYASYNNNFK